MHLLPNWMDLSTWEDLWTGFAITSLFTIPAVIMSHLKTKKHLKKNHEKVKDLLDPNTPGGLGDMNLENLNE